MFLVLFHENHIPPTRCLHVPSPSNSGHWNSPIHPCALPKGCLKITRFSQAFSQALIHIYHSLFLVENLLTLHPFVFVYYCRLLFHKYIIFEICIQKNKQTNFPTIFIKKYHQTLEIINGFYKMHSNVYSETSKRPIHCCLSKHRSFITLKII